MAHEGMPIERGRECEYTIKKNMKKLLPMLWALMSLGVVGIVLELLEVP
jgi:hypothetical protein